jgi:hypothetical protein
MRVRSILIVAVCAAVAALLALPALAQQPASANPPVRFRGTVSKVEGDKVTLKERSGQEMTLMMNDKTGFIGVKKASLKDVTKDKFVGITSMPQPDGSLKAVEVHIFPEERRGTGEGHYDWDLQPNSKMTNANISAQVSGKNGQELTLTPKDHEPVKITVPKNTTIVTYVPADRTMLKKGAKVFVIANKGADGSITVLRFNIGMGVTPPM